MRHHSVHRAVSASQG